VAKMDDAQVNLKPKDASVCLSVHPSFCDAAPILKTAWIMAGAECVVTAGLDTTGHSEHSEHYHGNELDLRISNLTSLGVNMEKFGLQLSKSLIESLGG